jgi:hypothetical protein
VTLNLSLCSAHLQRKISGLLVAAQNLEAAAEEAEECGMAEEADDLWSTAAIYFEQAETAALEIIESTPVPEETPLFHQGRPLGYCDEDEVEGVFVDVQDELMGLSFRADQLEDDDLLNTVEHIGWLGFKKETSACQVREALDDLQASRRDLWRRIRS